MLDQSQRTAILELRNRGHGIRAIARALKLSRKAVRDVLGSGSNEVPPVQREERAAGHLDEILDLYASCKGNLVRVHEELLAAGASLSYQALTGFCRRHGIGTEPKKPAGRYHFEPGQEMQHDTSPHQAKIAGVLRPVQTASVVLCFSRMIFIQLYPSFTRFWSKVFLLDALQYFGAVSTICMIDNTHVVVLRGTGAEMVPVPEMAAFAERMGFTFRAHEKGDANRSARVERPFDFVENNFLAGRAFCDWEDLNRQAIAWCDKVNGTFNSRLHASRRELYAAERPHMKALPIWMPPIYQLHHRVVDTEGYVNLHRTAYSVPYQLMGRQVEVRETKDTVEIYQGPRIVASHKKRLDPTDGRVAVAEHRPPRGEGRPRNAPRPEEEEISRIEPSLVPYATALKTQAAGRISLVLRRFLAMVRDYPRAPLLEAVWTASEYGMFDLDRLERMILKGIARDYFVLPIERKDEDDE